jgi:hypothetical protein
MKSVNFEFLAIKLGVATYTLHLVVKLQKGSGSKLLIACVDYMYSIPCVEDYGITEERNGTVDLTSWQEVFNIELKKNKLLVSLKPEKVIDQWMLFHVIKI